MKTLEECYATAMLLGMDYDRHDHTMCTTDTSPMKCFDPDTMELVASMADDTWSQIIADRIVEVRQGKLGFRKTYD